jgi:hypothetical protein
MRIRAGNGMRLILMAAAVVVVALLQVGAWATACNPTYVTQRGKVITVKPTGADDTANIQCALNKAVSLGAGSTVQLTCATYFTGMIEATGFNGTFKGAGKDATIIHSLPNLPCGDVPPPDWPALFKFRGSHVTVSDITFDITDPAPCLPYWDGQLLNGILGVTDSASAVSGCADMPGPSAAGLTVARVAFKGVGNVDDGYSVDVALFFAPECFGVQTHMLAGDFVVTASSFERANIAIVANQIANSRVRIGGSPYLKNTTSDVHQPVLIMDFDNSLVDISHNDLEGNWAVIQGYEGNAVTPTAPSSFIVSQNKIRADVYADGMYLADWTSPDVGKMLWATVFDNDFLMNADCCGAINGWWNTKDVLVFDNRFTGNSNYGIALGFIRWGTDTGWKLFLNDFKDLEVGWVPVYLGKYSSKCLVVEGRNKFDVLDEGTDNVIIGGNSPNDAAYGSNISGATPRPDLPEAIQRKIDKMRLHR